MRYKNLILIVFLVAIVVVTGTILLIALTNVIGALALLVLWVFLFSFAWLIVIVNTKPANDLIPARQSKDREIERLNAELERERQIGSDTSMEWADEVDRLTQEIEELEQLLRIAQRR